MKIEQYTFEKLYRLTCVENRMRVTAAYHKMLRRTWEEFRPDEPFMVSVAANKFEGIAQPWENILRFLSHPDHRKNLRDLADLDTPSHCSPARSIRFVEFDEHAGNFCRAARLAHLMQAWVSSCGVDCRVIQKHNGFDVMGHTDEIGVAMLYRKSGPTVSWMLTPTFYRMFPWVTRTDTSVRVNPLRRPVYTPDVQTEIEEIIVR